MTPKTETSGDDAAEEWSNPVNWEEDSAIKAEWRRRFARLVLDMECRVCSLICLDETLFTNKAPCKQVATMKTTFKNFAL